MKVKDLIEHLKQGNLDAQVVVFDAYGTPHEIGKRYFEFISLAGQGCFTRKGKGKEQYLSIVPAYGIEIDIQDD